jgi:hypothetical protein
MKFRRCAAIWAGVALAGMSATAAPTVNVLDLAARLAAEPQYQARVRAITRGPNFHWFGYYDRLQFDPSGRYVLGLEVGFEGRSPRSDDVVKVGMVDLQDGDRWLQLGESRAWCWQQGCHLQWRPGSATEILWNDREGDHFVCRVLDVKTGAQRTLPWPIDVIAPDGKSALGVDFGRIVNHRPGYGYAGVPDPNRSVAAPADSGVYRLDLATGERKLLVSCAQMESIPAPYIKPGERRYINHVQWSPDGSRFLFFDRGGPGGVGFTRVFTALAADGSDVRFLDKVSSHYQWRDPSHVIIWNNGYRLFADDGSGKGELLWQAPNGHPSFLPDRRWMVTDTYPEGPERLQFLYLADLLELRFIPLGAFHLPPEYKGEWRCDLHPRVSPDGRRICFDSPHASGRQMYLVALP